MIVTLANQIIEEVILRLCETVFTSVARIEVNMTNWSMGSIKSSISADSISEVSIALIESCMGHVTAVATTKEVFEEEWTSWIQTCDPGHSHTKLCKVLAGKTTSMRAKTVSHTMELCC